MSTCRSDSASCLKYTPPYPQTITVSNFEVLRIDNHCGDVCFISLSISTTPRPVWLQTRSNKLNVIQSAAAFQIPYRRGVTQPIPNTLDYSTWGINRVSLIATGVLIWNSLKNLCHSLKTTYTAAGVQLVRSPITVPAYCA